jgi:putative transposase
MSWSVSKTEVVRLEFVMFATEPCVSVSEACRQFGISRRTGYKWLERHEAEGLLGLSDRSRRPNTSPLQVSGDVVVALVRLRNKHPHWGPKKLRVLLAREGLDVNLIPCAATVGRVLRRSGLIVPSHRGRPRQCLPEGPLTAAQGPNTVWTVDLKGWWRTGNGQRCEPLTVRDLYSRYILCLRPMERSRVEETRAVFELIFNRYGLPEIIRSDNGAPFAALTGPHGLTRLSAWWRALGIRLERIEPGHPEQNGGHERMHQDVAREIEKQPAANLVLETKRLERWRIEYNLHRPHEGLGMKTPGEVYRPSSRRLSNVEPYAYPPSFALRRVDSDGCISVHGKSVHLSDALSRQEVGLEYLTETSWRVWFCDLRIKEIETETEDQNQAGLPRPCNPCPDNKV